MLQTTLTKLSLSTSPATQSRERWVVQPVLISNDEFLLRTSIKNLILFQVCYDFIKVRISIAYSRTVYNWKRLTEIPKYIPYESLVFNSNPLFQNEYNDWVVKEQRHILQILEELPSLTPPLDHVLELLPRLQARYYSIASSSKCHPDSVHVCAALVRYNTSTGRAAEGVCTSWLEKMVPNGLWILFYVFRYPKMAYISPLLQQSQWSKTTLCIILC